MERCQGKRRTKIDEHICPWMMQVKIDGEGSSWIESTVLSGINVCA